MHLLSRVSCKANSIHQCVAVCRTCTLRAAHAAEEAGSQQILLREVFHQSALRIHDRQHRAADHAAACLPTSQR